MNKSVYRIPARFGMDWLESASWEEVGTARLVHDSGSTIQVEADDAAMGDLLDRAKYYASFDGEDYHENHALCRSAKRTVAGFPGQLLVRFGDAFKSAAR